MIKVIKNGTVITMDNKREKYEKADIVITDDTIKILEINSLPAMSTPQVLVGPMYTIPAAKTFFQKKLNSKESR